MTSTTQCGSRKRRLALAVFPAFASFVASDIHAEQAESVSVDGPQEATEKTCANDASGSCSPEGEKRVPTNLEECGIWLAPSSIPGAGLGMYAGIIYAKGDLLGPSGEIVVPQIDINQHAFEIGEENYFNLWDEYTWSGLGLLMGHEGYVDVKVQSPGFGSAANSFIDLINVDERYPQNNIPHGLHRSRDPGAGAFSTYHNRESVAAAPIQQGEELFVDYGQAWFRDRPFLGPIPLLGDLDRATQIFQRHLDLRRKYPNVRDDIFDVLWVTFVENTEFVDSRVLASFRKTREEWQGLFQGKTLKEIRIEEGLRTDEWLREHGTCADNIREGESTIRQAGRGAFAHRLLVKDSVVAPMPMIHISDYHILEMLEFEDIRSLKLKMERKLIGRQLTLNYCFGHEESTLLLCPYGPLTSLINHNRTQANVRLQWADPSKGNHEPELLKRPIEHFARDKTAKLAMELIATRDIMPGEEIFLDYGKSWEDAWNGHVRSWKPYAGADRYISAFELNTSPFRLRTEFEQIEYPYPGNVNLQCDQKFFQKIDYDKFQRTGEIEVLLHHESNWQNCEVLRFEEVNGTLRYTAVVLLPEDNIDKLSRAPREAFKFIDRPYTSDMFLPFAFRHPMMIPDELFPEYWMNL